MRHRKSLQSTCPTKLDSTGHLALWVWGSASLSLPWGPRDPLLQALSPSLLPGPFPPPCTTPSSPVLGPAPPFSPGALRAT